MNNHSISRIESVKDEGEGHHHGGVEDLLISDIQQNQSVNRGVDGEQEDLEQLLRTGGFAKQMMMESTVRDLGSSIKAATANLQNNVHQEIVEDNYDEDFEGEGSSQIHHH